MLFNGEVALSPQISLVGFQGQGFTCHEAVSLSCKIDLKPEMERAAGKWLTYLPSQGERQRERGHSKGHFKAERGVLFQEILGTRLSCVRGCKFEHFYRNG